MLSTLLIAVMILEVALFLMGTIFMILAQKKACENMLRANQRELMRPFYIGVFLTGASFAGLIISLIAIAKASC